MSVFLGVVEISFGVLVYFFVMILIKGVTKEDFFIIKEVLKRRRNQKNK